MKHPHLFVAVISAILFSGAVFAQGAPYPSKPVTLIIPLAASGPVDIETRMYAGKLSPLMGQPFLVDYKAGASGAIAAAYVANATPDGHTLLVIVPSFTTLPSLYKNLSFDVAKDFAPVSMASKRFLMLALSPTFPAKTYAEYLAYARDNPGKINIGTTGSGGATHLGTAWLHSATGTRATFIHYKGLAALVPDLLAGRIDAAVATLSQVNTSKLRTIVMLSGQRAPTLPDLPTAAELGVTGYDFSAYTGFSAPAATPIAIISKLNDAFVKVVKMSDVITNLEGLGGVAVGSTAAEFRQIILSETAVWRKVIAENAIQLQE